MDLNKRYHIAVRMSIYSQMCPVIVGKEFYEDLGLNILTDMASVYVKRATVESWLASRSFTKVTDELYRISLSALALKQLMIQSYLQDGRPELANKLKKAVTLSKDINHLRRCFQLPVVSR